MRSFTFFFFLFIIIQNNYSQSKYLDANYAKDGVLKLQHKNFKLQSYAFTEEGDFISSHYKSESNRLSYTTNHFSTAYMKYKKNGKVDRSFGVNGKIESNDWMYNRETSNRTTITKDAFFTYNPKNIEDEGLLYDSDGKLLFKIKSKGFLRRKPFLLGKDEQDYFYFKTTNSTVRIDKKGFDKNYIDTLALTLTEISGVDHYDQDKYSSILYGNRMITVVPVTQGGKVSQYRIVEINPDGSQNNNFDAEKQLIFTDSKPELKKTKSGVLILTKQSVDTMTLIKIDPAGKRNKNFGAEGILTLGLEEGWKFRKFLTGLENGNLLFDIIQYRKALDSNERLYLSHQNGHYLLLTNSKGDILTENGDNGIYAIDFAPGTVERIIADWDYQVYVAFTWEKDSELYLMKLHDNFFDIK